MRIVPVLLAALVGSGCAKAPPAGNPEFNDALRFAFVAFDGEEVDLAFAIRDLEAEIYANIDVTAESAQDRAVTPERLTEEDVAGVEHPDRVPALALPVAVAGLSAHPVDAHASIQVMADQRPVEPYSPDKYDRTMLVGGDCWLDRSCDRMDTQNVLIKKNMLMEIEYTLWKDFRWVDLGLPDPVDVPEGEEPTNPGEPRWAVVGRSWTTEPAVGEKEDATIHQSYTIEVWIPREEEGGTLRMLCLWGETEFNGISFTDDQVAGTTRAGIDENFVAADEFLSEAE